MSVRFSFFEKNSMYRNICLFLLFLIFSFLKKSDLFLPIWHDETSYAPFNLWKLEGSFFLPWNYESTWFMGHPFLHPFILASSKESVGQ